MNKLKAISLLWIAFFIMHLNPVFGQIQDSQLSKYALDSGTFSYRVVDSNCSEPTWSFYNMTSWDSSPYKEGFFKWIFNMTGIDPATDTYDRGGTPFMNFRLLFPNGYDKDYAPGYPMILMMHGAGERANCWNTSCYIPKGNLPNANTAYLDDCSDTTYYNSTSTTIRYRNNDHNLLHGGQPHLTAVNLAGTLKAEDPTLPQRAFPGFVLFPQNDNGWDTDAIDRAYMIVRKLIDSLNIDPNRIYVHGLSNGGNGTWRMFQRYPFMFAAALPMSAEPVPTIDSTAVHHPIWVFQGGKDTNPLPSQTKRILEEYASYGGTYKYTEYPNLGHGTWNTAYAEQEFFSWMLEQNKANIHVYYGDSSFCSTDNKGVRIGVAQGFKAYQWRKDGEILADSTDEDIIVHDPGIYEVRFSRVSANPTSESEWNRWSDPVEIKERSAETPSIVANGTTVLPDINSQDSVYLFAPEGYGSYEWFKDSNPVAIDTSFLKLSGTNDAGEYTLIVKTLDGCPSLESEPITVLSNAPQTINTPQNFIATPISSTSVRLSWQVNSQDEQGFEIYRTTTSGTDYSFVALVDAQELSYMDSSLVPNTTYYYEIRAISNSARSDYYSPERSATTFSDLEAPLPPDNLTVLSRTINSVTLSWDASHDNSYIQDYYIYYGSDSIPTGGLTEFTVPDLTINSYFTFTVKAVDGGGQFSVKSEPVYANTIFSGLHYEHSTGAWDYLTDIDWSFVEFSGDISNFNISGTTQADYFNFKFDGYIFIPSDGTYTFYTSSDDGSRLYIGGFDQNTPSTNLVVDNDGKHGTTEKSGSIYLTAGPHLITVLFFEYTGGQSLQVKWAGPGITKQLIPDSALKSGTVITNPAPDTPSSLVATADSVEPSISLSWDYLGEQPENLNVVVLGSSTAEGTGASSYSNSWVGQLDTWLGANTTNHTLTNLALGGFTTYDIRPTGSDTVTYPPPNNTVFVPNDTLNITKALSLDPDIILINLPSNNIASNIPIDSTMMHYREIKALADAAGVPVYITTTQPRNFQDSGKRAALEQEADSVRESFGDYVIDIYDSLTDFTNDRIIKAIYDSGDGIHVNDLGHTYIYNTVLIALKRHLTNFQIYRSFTSGGPYQLISNTENGAQSYVDEGLVPDSTYYYVVRTVNLNGVSGNSNEASATVVTDSTPPTDPSNLTYTAANFTQASLIWDASTDNIKVSGYEIYRDNVLVDSAFTESYIATGLLPTQTYDFKVRAYDQGGNFSNYSNVVNVSTAGATTYYLKSSGSIADLSSWDTAEDGSAGVQPLNFTNNGQYFVIKNQTPAVLSSDWTVTGEVSKVIVESGEEFDVESNFSGTIEGKAGSLVNLNSASDPSFINMDQSSTVNFESLSTSIPLASYGNVNLMGDGTTKIFQEGETEIRGDLTCNTGVVLKGASNNGSILKISGDLTMSSPGFASTDNRLTIDFDGNASQSLITDSDIKFYKLKAENDTDVLLSASPGTEVTLGTSLGGGITVSSGSTLDLSGVRLKVSGSGTINSGNETGEIGLENSIVEFISTASVNSNLYPMVGKNAVVSIDYDAPSTTSLVIQGGVDVKNYINVTQGIVNSNGHMRLLSTSDTTSAYVKSLSSGAQITGDVSVQRYMEGEGKLWRHISSPVAGATVDQLQESIPVTGIFAGASTGYTDNPSMYSYDESQVGNEWINFPPDDGDSTEVLVSGRGYVVWIRE
ncbi:MAG: fibronectin type III domain-containing protein, partial [Cyclobacteriaceae bacterium]|nr:fibronectin type III domain-containing protein [Cyclobacteriaceae bacterium]